MPPRTQFTKEQIIDAAFGIARDIGLSGITARGVADRLGSSVGPIYSHFENIEDLERKVVQRSIDLMDEYSRRQWSEIPFLNMGVGFVCFARDEPVLFDISCKNGPKESVDEALDQATIDRMREDPTMDDFTDQELKRIFQKLSYLAYGMATLSSQKAMPDDSTDNIIQILREAGGDIMFMTKARKMLNDPGITEEEMKALWGHIYE